MRHSPIAATPLWGLPYSLAVLTALAACAAPLRLQIPTESHIAAAPLPGDTTASASDSITIQVRYLPHSPSVSVLAWRADQPGYGLRASVLSDGSLAGQHAIYVSTTYRPEMPQSPRAMIPSMPLRAYRGFRDLNACRFGECSPFTTMNALIPDHVLRATRDATPVRFYEDVAARRGPQLSAATAGSGGPRDFTITIDPALVAAYLATIDSVSGELRRRD
jgi:hypothetical protein